MRAGPPPAAAVSQEAALKYFLLGAYASAFFLFGVALVYGFAGGGRASARSTTAVADAAATAPVLLFVGLAMLAIGLLFKAAAAPFHVWTPDVYQGAPTPVTALHGGLHQGRRVRCAAAGALRRRSTACGWDFTPVLGAIAVLTMLVGAILAVTQTDLKRLLAYSSIANAGYLLVGVLAGQQGRACPARCSTWWRTASR